MLVSICALCYTRCYWVSVFCVARNISEQLYFVLCQMLLSLCFVVCQMLPSVCASCCAWCYWASCFVLCLMLLSVCFLVGPDSTEHLCFALYVMLLSVCVCIAPDVTECLCFMLCQMLLSVCASCCARCYWVCFVSYLVFWTQVPYRDEHANRLSLNDDMFCSGDQIVDEVKNVSILPFSDSFICGIIITSFHCQYDEINFIARQISAN
jgi:hypothetical protein